MVLFLSINAPDLALPIPNWAKKKRSKRDGVLGWEISPNLRLVSPHHWPHPVWIGAVVTLSLLMISRHCSPFGTIVFLVLYLACMFLCVRLDNRYAMLSNVLRVVTKH